MIFGVTRQLFKLGREAARIATAAPPGETVMPSQQQTLARCGVSSYAAEPDVTVRARGRTRRPPASRERYSSAAGQASNLEDYSTLSDMEVLEDLNAGNLNERQLETKLGDAARAVRIRRAMVNDLVRVFVDDKAAKAFEKLPHEDFDTGQFFKQIQGANCECVVGYVPVPVGVIGPVMLDGRSYSVPLATTEGALLASANRGARAIALAGGATSSLTRDLMSRAPVFMLPSAAAAAEIKKFVESEAGMTQLRTAFSKTTRFGEIDSVRGIVAGRNLFVKFNCKTADAMGMNMVSKGVNAAVESLARTFPKAKLTSISGNMCTDKKPSAINWIEGRGKSVVCEVVLPEHIVRDVLKTDPETLIHTNKVKNLIGSAMAGSIGGNNAHAANLVAAIFLACGQDIAQVVESANCMTLIEPDVGGNGAVHVSVTMPSIEVGTVGGGTNLPGQKACLGMLGVHGQKEGEPGAHSQQLSRIVAVSVLCGELSLIAALASDQLVKAHMELGRK